MLTHGLYREFINQEIRHDKEDPKEPSHFDYKFLKSKAGPLYTSKENEEAQPLVDQQQKRKDIHKFSFERKKYGGIRMC